MAGDVEEHAAGEQRGQARRIAGRRAEVTDMVRGVGPSYQWSSSPMVTWASASMCAPECVVEVMTSVMRPRCTSFGVGAHRFSAPARSRRGVR
jgi:hypothetical protein